MVSIIETSLYSIVWYSKETMNSSCRYINDDDGVRSFVVAALRCV